MKFSPSVLGLEKRELLSTVTEVKNSYTDSITGHSMVEYTKLVEEILTPVTTGTVTRDEVRYFYYHEVDDNTNNEYTINQTTSQYIWDYDSSNSTVHGFAKFKALDVDYNVGSSSSAVTTLYGGSDPTPPTGGSGPVGPRNPPSIPGGTDPPPPDGNGDPPISDPNSPTGPPVPALAINEDVTATLDEEFGWVLGDAFYSDPEVTPDPAWDY